MASTAKPKSRSGDVGGYKFINVSLSNDDKERLATYADEMGESLAVVFDLVSEGYKVSISLDSKHDSFIASLTDNNPKSSFHKYILTGRGTTALDAIASLCYKHYLLAEGDWSRLPFSDSVEKSRFG